MDKERIREALDYAAYYRSEVGDLINGRGDDVKAVCPFHADNQPSLSINLKSGLYRCFGCDARGDVFHFYQKKHGCEFPEAVKGLGNFAGLDVGVKDRPRKIAATYDYQDPAGKVLFQVVREEPKKFWQRRPDGNGKWINNVQGVELVPYRLPELVKADTAFISEGEKDADNLAARGMIATTNPMGAGKWRSEFNQYFRGKQVVILPHNDPPGRDHAQAVAQALQGVAASIKVVELPGLPEKGDVSDFLAAGGTIEALQELVRQSPQFSLFPEVISGTDLENFIFPDIQFVIQGIMPVGFGLISARPKKGKSFLALNISVAVALNGAALGKKDLELDPGPVLYICYEDKKRRMQKRLTTIMQGESFPANLYLAESWPKINEGGLERLGEYLTANPDTKVVVIDTLGRFKPRKKAREDAYDADLATGGALADLAHRHNVCILGIFHNRKAESEEPLDDVHGSTGLTAAADFVMVLKRGKGQADAEMYVTGRDVEEQSLALKFHHEEGTWELLGAAEDVARSQARQDVIDLLHEKGTLTSKEIAGILGKKENAVKKLLWTMKGDGEIKYKEGKYSVFS